MEPFTLKPALWSSAIAGVLLALCSTSSWAICTVKGPALLNVAVPAYLKVPKNTPNGTEIYRSTPAAVISSTNTWICEAGDHWGYLNSRGETMLNDANPIGTTGLGWRWVYNGKLLGTYPNSDMLTPNYDYTLINTTYAIALYKIGEITPGSIPGGELGTQVVTGGTIATMTLSNAIALTEVSCQTPSVNVDLGKQRSSQFGGVGTTIGKKAFNINLHGCPTGVGGISYRLDPVNTAFDAQTGVLALDEGGATGVGIQITDESDKVVSLGEVHPLLRNPDGINYVIPLKAAYYKTANTVNGGKANASMQFTITYQ